MNDFWRDVSETYRPPVFLPDIGTFFNQDLALAESLLKQVAHAGARYIKGEILHDADICLPTDVTEKYLDANATPRSENYRQLIERKVVPLAKYRELFAPLPELGMHLVLSVYDNQGAEFAAETGACAIKIASTNVVHAPLIRHCASLGLPLIIDTGRATLAEAQRAVDWALAAGAEHLVLEYSPPAPPAALEKHNLRVLPDLRAMFGLPVGLSDHHNGEEMLYAASALGCRVLEKGLCPDSPDDDQDVFHALPVGQLQQVMARCQHIHAALGESHAAYPAPPCRPTARMGLVTRHALQAGERIGPETVRFAFPTLGIPVEEWDLAEGKTLNQPVAADTPLEWHHVSR